MDIEVRERFERIEANMLQFSEGMKDVNARLSEVATSMKDFGIKVNELASGMKNLQEAQGRTNEVLHTLLDALFTQRGNGHSKQQLPE